MPPNAISLCAAGLFKKTPFLSRSSLRRSTALAFVREQDETLSCGRDRELAELMEQISGLLPPNVPRQRDAPEQSGMTMR